MHSLQAIKSVEILGTVGLFGAVYYKRRLFAKGLEYWFKYIWSINPKFLNDDRKY